MSRILFVIIAVLFAPQAGMCRDTTKGYIDVEIKYTSLFPGQLQIRDEICKPPRGVECEKAMIKLRTKECQGNNPPSACEEARALLETSSCLAGLIYDDRVGRDEKIRVSLCGSSSGFGNVSIRNVRNGNVWTNYSLLSDGDAITYP